MAQPMHIPSRPSRLKESSGAVMRRVAIVGPTGASLRHLRGPLVSALTAGRHQVMLFARSFEPADEAALRAKGLNFRLLAETGGGIPILSDWRAVSGLTKELQSFQPNIVLAYGADTLLPSIKAAHWAKVSRIVGLINELPTDKRDQRQMRAVARALELVDAAVFHNGDQPKWLREQGLLPRDLSFVVVPGAGVDLAYHGVQPLPDIGAGLVFLMNARMDVQKGVLDYARAAQDVKARAPSARFLLAGLDGQGGQGITDREMEPYLDALEILGPLEDVRSAFARAHVFVYPSHAEGMPRPVLEALAAGRPVITTNGPGCRDTVDERINGVLVPPSDPDALASAMESFLKRPDLIPSMARASRAKAERRFDERAVNAALFQVMGLS